MTDVYQHSTDAPQDEETPSHDTQGFRTRTPETDHDTQGFRTRTPEPYAETAHDLCLRGLTPIPTGGEDGKSPLVRWPTHPYSKRAIQSLGSKYPTANIGVLCGLSGVTVVDIDDLALLPAMIERFGDTPLQTQTPSGGVHLWYRANGEGNAQRLDGVAVDIRGVGGYVVVPPSVRPSGVYAGQPYRFLKGGWDDLPRLPTIKAGSLTPQLHGKEAVQKGMRNRALFAALLTEARACDDLESLTDVAHTLNADLSPPLPTAEVQKTAISAWNYEQRGENWSGSGARVVIAEWEHALLLGYPDALALWVRLRFVHGARAEPFALSAKAMRKAQVIPDWGLARYRTARDILLTVGFLSCVFSGGHSQHAPSLYVFRTPPDKPSFSKDARHTPCSRGLETEHNITEHPLPSQEEVGEAVTLDLFHHETQSNTPKQQGFGPIIREARIQQGLSQKDVAQRLGLSRSTYGNIETGTYSASQSTVIRLRELLGLSYFTTPKKASFG